MTMTYAVLQLIGGLGAFLIGVNALSRSANALASRRLNTSLGGKKHNLVFGVLIGAAFTALIQSSSLTTVITVGLVNANVLTLLSATALIMGANIGTTITGQIAALQSFSVSGILVACAGLGILLEIAGKKEKTKKIGLFLSGLGLVFIGLNLMTGSMSAVKESTNAASLLASLSNPFLLFACGLGLTAIVQSSSAVTSLVIAMAASGLSIGSGGNSVFYVILGTNVGTCVTALLSSIGTSPNARRAAIIHLLFNVLGSALFFFLLLAFPGFREETFARWFPYEATQIAMFHTAFNVICTVLFLPFARGFVALSCLIVRDKAPEKNEALDERLLMDPDLALSQAESVAYELTRTATAGLGDIIFTFLEGSAPVTVDRDRVQKTSQELTNYLVRLSSNPHVSRQSARIAYLHEVNSAALGIAFRSSRLATDSQSASARTLVFSETVKEDLGSLTRRLLTLAGTIQSGLLKNDMVLLQDARQELKNLDDRERQIATAHVARLGRGECHPENNALFTEVLASLRETQEDFSRMLAPLT